MDAASAPPWRTRGNRVQWALRAVSHATIRYSVQPVRLLENVPCSLVMFTVPTDGGMFGAGGGAIRKGTSVRLYFRGDAAFASPEIYEYLEPRGITLRHPPQSEPDSPARLPICLRDLSVARRPCSRFPRRWQLSGRIVEQEALRDRGQVEWHPGELVPASVSSSLIVAPYQPGGRRYRSPWLGGAAHISRKAENAINWTRLSCRSSATGAVRLQLPALAYNLGASCQDTGFAPKEVEHWSMATLRDKLVKIGWPSVVRHGRYVTFQLAEVAVPRDLFRTILSLIDDLRRRPAPA